MMGQKVMAARAGGTSVAMLVPSQVSPVVVGEQEGGGPGVPVHHEKLLIPVTGIQFIPGIWHARENKFHTRESLFIFPCAPREYEY